MLYPWFTYRPIQWDGQPQGETLPETKVQKLSLGRYLFKRYCFVPKGSILVPQMCILVPKRYNFEKVRPQPVLLYLYLRVYRLNWIKLNISQRERHLNATVADHLVMNGTWMERKVSDACADLTVSVFRDRTLFCLVNALQSAKTLYSCSCLLSQLSAHEIRDSRAGSRVSGLPSETR